MNIRYSIVYNFKKSLNKNGKALIYIRATLNGKHRYFKIAHIAPHQWDIKKKRVKNHPEHILLNKLIYSELEKMETFEYELLKRGDIVSLERLGDYKLDAVLTSFTEFYEKQLEAATIKNGSYTDQRQTLHKLKEYKSSVYFSELNFRLVNGFNSFLLNDKKLSVNTAAKHHKNLKKYINLAISSEYLDINKNPYKKFKVKREPTKRLYLTETELKQFENVNLSDNKGLERIRDFFLFCCYTGIRCGDARAISRNDLLVTEEGIRLYFKAEKSGKFYDLNLRKLFKIKRQQRSRPEHLLQKRINKIADVHGYEYDSTEPPLFLGMSNQHINRQLKKIAKKLLVRGVVKTDISIHSGRHTFGTIMAGKVPIPVLQKLLQHSKVKETMIYVHLNNQMVNQALDKIVW